MVVFTDAPCDSVIVVVPLSFQCMLSNDLDPTINGNIPLIQGISERKHRILNDLRERNRTY